MRDFLGAWKSWGERLNWVPVVLRSLELESTEAPLVLLQIAGAKRSFLRHGSSDWPGLASGGRTGCFWLFQGFGDLKTEFRHHSKSV